MNKDNIHTKEKIRELLADHLGLEIGDINDDDSIIDDLHMTPSDFTDFISALETEGFDVSKTKMDETDTVEELIDSILG